MNERPLAGDGSVPDLYADCPIVLSYGLGLDSTAVLGCMHMHGITPNYIMFADVGSEHDETYDYLPVIQEWLRRVGFPQVTVVRYVPKRFKYEPYVNIWENCVVNGTLPSLAFGRKGCSLKWKAAPMDKHLESLDWVKETFAAGKQIQRLIGYDCGDQDLKRFTKAVQKVEDGKTDPRYHYVYPLHAWGLDRIGCAAVVSGHMNLPVPHKSSCFFCLAGETEVLTSCGLKTIDQLTGKTVKVLIPVSNGNFKTGQHGSHKFQAFGKWENATFQSFGIQDIFEVELGRRAQRKTIRCTPEHRWFLDDGTELTTHDLKPGDKLAHCRRLLHRGLDGHNLFQLSPIAIAQGFVFGDGSAGSVRDAAPASVRFHGTKVEMLKWFSFSKVMDANGIPYVSLLPRIWKQLPSLQESSAFLCGWLAGYFAADGSVTKKGSAEITSSVKRNLEFVRDVCHLLGIRCGQINDHHRKGFNGIEILYRLTIVVSDLPKSFWVREKHAHNATSAGAYSDRYHGWRVVAVTDTRRSEEVFCTTVPGGAFVLSDHLVTGNCPAMQPPEVESLPQDKLEQIVIMEALAAPDLKTVEGLWRKSTKTRPGRMTDFIRDKKLLPEDRLIACIYAPQIEVRKYLGKVRSPLDHASRLPIDADRQTA